MSDQRPTSNPLLLPFVAVCLLCAAEAVVIAFLFGRGNAATPALSRITQTAEPLSDGPDRPREMPPAPAPAIASAPATAVDATRTPGRAEPPTRKPAPAASPAPAPAPPASRGPAIARGKVGQRVESAGFAITVVAASNKPRFDIFAPRPDEKFVDCDVLLENAGTKGFDYFSNQFKIQDDQSRVFTGGALGVGDPQLGYGTIVQGNKVRGHVAFIVPKDAKGLTLTYPIDDAPGNARAIHVDLGQ
jgi:hypothetical protein